MTLPPALLRYRDAVLAVVLAGAFIAELLFSGEIANDRAMTAAVGAAMALSLSVRRSAPLVPLCAAVMGILLSHTVLTGLADSGSFLLVLLLALFAAGRYGPRWSRWLAGLVAAAVIPLAAVDPDQPPTAGDWIFFFLFIGTAYAGGLLFRARHERDLRMAQRAEQAERDSEGRAREAVTEERTRIARELHDIVAHAIGVIVVQARAGRRALVEFPAEATRTPSCRRSRASASLTSSPLRSVPRGCRWRSSVPGTR